MSPASRLRSAAGLEETSADSAVRADSVDRAALAARFRAFPALVHQAPVVQQAADLARRLVSLAAVEASRAAEVAEAVAAALRLGPVAAVLVVAVVDLAPAEVVRALLEQDGADPWCSRCLAWRVWLASGPIASASVGMTITGIQR